MNASGPEHPLERFSIRVTEWSGSSGAFLASIVVVSGWAMTGPLFQYSDAWQLVINTLTNIVTFVMVFLIQRTQNKDSLATQLKLNELIAAVHGASNCAMVIDYLSWADLHRLHQGYLELAARHQDDESTSLTHDQSG